MLKHINGLCNFNFYFKIMWPPTNKITPSPPAPPTPQQLQLSLIFISFPFSVLYVIQRFSWNFINILIISSCSIFSNCFLIKIWMDMLWIMLVIHLFSLMVAEFSEHFLNIYWNPLNILENSQQVHVTSSIRKQSETQE